MTTRTIIIVCVCARFIAGYIHLCVFIPPYVMSMNIGVYMKLAQYARIHQVVHVWSSKKPFFFGDVVFQQSLVEWAGTPIHGFRPLRWTSLINSLTWDANQQGCWSKWSNLFSLQGLQPNATWQKWFWHKIIWGDICDRLGINIGGLAQWHLHSDCWSRRACPGSNEFIYGAPRTFNVHR